MIASTIPSVMKISSPLSTSTTAITQETQGRKRKERDEDESEESDEDEDDDDSNFYSKIDPQLLADIPSAKITLPGSDSKSSPKQSPLFIPGLNLSSAAHHATPGPASKRLKPNTPTRIQSPESRLKPSHWSNKSKWFQKHAQSPSKYLETRRSDVASKVVNLGGIPPPLPSTQQYTYKAAGHAHLRPTLEKLFRNDSVRNAVDDFMGMKEEERRREQKQKLNDERQESILKYEMVVGSLERKFTFERRMKNAGAEKIFVRAKTSLKRIAKDRKLKRAMIKRGKSSGLRTCWSFCTSKMSKEQEEQILEDEFDEALEEGMEEAFNWAYQEKIKELQEDNGLELRKKVAKNLECLYKWI